MDSFPTQASTRKVKPVLILNEARDDGVLGCSGISQTICKQSALCSGEITTPTPYHSIFRGWMLFLTPNQQYQSTEGKKTDSGEREKFCTHTHTHTHTHTDYTQVQTGTGVWTQVLQHTQYTRLTALFPGLPGSAGTRRVKPIWILLKQETVSGSGTSWAICKSASRSKQITMPVPHHSFFTGRMPFLPPNQQRQSTEGNFAQ